MKIISWNINGYRAVITKSFYETIVALSPDILFLQEIKAKPEQVPEEKRNIPGYQMVWNSAERPGYSGVATYFKLPPDDIRFGLGLAEFDMEGRMIWTRYGKVWLGNSYFPNGQRGRDRVDFKLAYYQRLLDKSMELTASGYDVIIGGDWNTAHTELDLANPKENVETSGFLPEEREWVTRFMDAGFRDVHREMYPESRDYSWWTYRFNARVRNIGWRIDYFLLTGKIADQAIGSRVHSDILGSDHCPVELLLDTTFGT